ncbi:MAG TPA: nitroreductase/quinone reductase family protein [Candidatus Binataceae bacterium]|nr:nitroreductase/quinone reductase family protein [Candidatus Binataceae bacterium]
MTTSVDRVFARPSLFERGFNRLFGAMVGLGLALPHNYLLQVRGRKSGRLYSAPIDLLVIDQRRFLVCPRGRSQWVRNAEAGGKVALKKGWALRKFTIRALPDDEKPEILERYLDSFKLTVQRYFPLPAGSPAQSFAEFANRYPVFELLATEDSSQP